jgi:hypothetical protein
MQSDQNLTLRETLLSHRERALAHYTSELAERSAGLDAKLAARGSELANEKHLLQAQFTAVAARERELEARLRAVEEWEASLRAREEALALASGSRDRRQGGTDEGEPMTEARQRMLSSRGMVLRMQQQQQQQQEEEDADGYEDPGDDADYGNSEEDVLNGGGGHGNGSEGYPLYEEVSNEEVSNDALADGASEGWHRLLDEASGRVYYWNALSGEVAWTLPGASDEEMDAEELEENEATLSTDAIWATEMPLEEPGIEEEELAAEHASSEPSEAPVTAPPIRSSLQNIHKRQQRAKTLGVQRRVVIVAPGEMRADAATCTARDVAAAAAAAAAKETATIHSLQPKKWAQQSDELRRAMAASRVAGVPPPPPDDALDGRVQCPKCMRRFGAAAADRHIPLCKHTRRNEGSEI